MSSIKMCLKKYIDFSGRASRPEFWYFILFLALVNFALSLFSNLQNNELKFALGMHFALGAQVNWSTNIFTALFALPALAVTIRRINDTGFPIGKYFAVCFCVFVILSFYSKLTNNQVPILIAIVPLLTLVGFFVYILARPSQVVANKHGPHSLEVPQ